MIDVVFLLIIFFMVATKFTELERDIELSLPEVAQAAAMTAKPQAREVAVHADGRMTLDRIDVTPQELTRQLAAAKEEYPGIGVVIRGDASCPYCHVAEALAACQEARITDLSRERPRRRGARPSQGGELWAISRQPVWHSWPLGASRELHGRSFGFYSPPAR